MSRQVIVERQHAGVLWGIKIQGGRDFGQKLRIIDINKDCIMATLGIKPGSEIISIGGVPTASMTHHEAQEAIIRCGNKLDLEIVEPASSQSFSTSPSQTFSHLDSSLGSDSQAYRPPSVIQSGSQTHLSVQNFRGTSPSYTIKPYTPPQDGSRSIQFRTPTPKHVSEYRPSNNSTGIPDISETIQLTKSNKKSPIQLPVYAPSPSPSQSEGLLSETTTVSPYGSSSEDRPNSLPRTILKTSNNRPVCYTCKREIHGPFIDTGYMCFCRDHFNCVQCGQSLENQQYSESNGKFYCAADFVKLVAPRCGKCHQPVVGLVTKALEQSWHPECFVCAQCYTPLRDVFHVEDTGDVLCKQHWDQLHLKWCASCKEPISEIDRFVDAFGKTFHTHCFCCAACRTPLEGKKFHPRDGKPFCVVHARAQALYN